MFCSQRAQRSLAVGAATGLNKFDRDAKFSARTFETAPGRLVKRFVVFAADVKHQANADAVALVGGVGPMAQGPVPEQENVGKYQAGSEPTFAESAHRSTRYRHRKLVAMAGDKKVFHFGDIYVTKLTDSGVYVDHFARSTVWPKF